MDFALGFTSPVRRSSKLELPLPVYKGKAYDNSMPIHIPMESDSSSMFGTGITRLVLPPYGSSCNYIQKSTQFSKSVQKIMLPKVPTLAISISQQTIVGGFVGSKSHAGRSMFGDSSQVWDALMCKFVELLSLDKEKPNSAAPKNKVTSSVGCGLDMDNSRNLQAETFEETISGSESVACSSRKCIPRNYKLCNLLDTTKLVPQNITNCTPIECKAVVSEVKEQTLHSIQDTLPSNRGTYSSGVDGTFKNENALSGSCTMGNLNQKDLVPEARQASLKRSPLQSYADVAKIIPNKSLARLNKSGCEVAQNLKNMWSCKIKRNKNNQDKKVVNSQGNKKKTMAMDDIVSHGDTRWKGDGKSKRAKIQKTRPISVASIIQSGTSSETEENSIADNCTKETRPDSGSECNWTIEEREPIHTEGLKEELRGRYPSECSLDSEDSFVIFEECPDTSLASSSSIPIDHDSSIEESESEDDSNSSDNSDYEDDVDNGGLLKFHCLPANSCVEDCNRIKKYSTQPVPEKAEGMKKKMVHFAEGSHLAVVRPMIAWGYAYRESRRGPWEVHARDRARFHCRIASLAPLLNAVLDPLHRRKVVASRLHDL